MLCRARALGYFRSMRLLPPSLTMFLLLAAACGEESQPKVPNDGGMARPDGGMTRADGGAAPTDSGPAGVDAGPADAGVEPPPPYEPAFFDLNHILSTGQSLSVGAAGAPALSTTQPYENKTFNTGLSAG